MKRRYLAVYDYRVGGVWALVAANSSAEITERYPVLIVNEDRPSWMTDEVYHRIAETSAFDIDDPPPNWLVDAIKASK
jgi:hypothetical protein